MYSEALVSAPLSRPKIHRLPVFLAHERQKQHMQRNGIYVAAVLVLLTLLAYATDRMARRSPEAQQQMTTGLAAYPPLDIVEEDKSLILPTVKHRQTVVITDKNGGIIGQLARIPTQNQQMAEIKTISEIDNRAGRELLGIIGKY